MTDYRRQAAIFDPSHHATKKVAIIGLGNIGSHTALALARMGVQNLTVFDFDSVEEHNLSSQAYSIEHVGYPKVDAIAETIVDTINSDAEVETVPLPYVNQPLGDDTIVICAVDSMIERRKIQRAILESGQNPLIIDGRMGGGQLEVHVSRAASWDESMPEQADTDPCSARYISYTSYIIAGFIANTVKRIWQGERYTKQVIFHADTYDIIREFYDES